jgi:predicted acetyltransferase
LADIVVRSLTANDSRADHLDLSIRAFGPHDEVILRAVADPVIADGRALAAFDGDRMVGAALFNDLRQWWFGKVVPMAGVSGVTVAPEYRGRGVGRGLMTALTELMAVRGYPLSALYPATTHIYRQLGWELAGARYEAKLPARSLLDLPRPAALPPAALPPAALPPAALPPVRRPGPGDAAQILAVVGAVHEQARDCGPVTWDERTMRGWLTAPGKYADSHKYAFLAPDGFAAYRWRGNDELYVHRVLAASAETTLALWSIIASHSSVADTVTAQVTPRDPLWWLLREQDAEVSERDPWLLRLLDAPAAIAARGFPAIDIDVPLHITDEQLPHNSGLWDLTVRSSGEARLVITDAGACAGAAARPALALGARGLAALYAGTPVSTLRRAGLAAGGEPRSDAALDAAFAASSFMLDGF